MPAQHESLATGPAATERETMAAETFDVYLSSTLVDLVTTRALIVKFFTDRGWKVKQSYDTDPREGTIESCLKDVRASRIYVAVVGFRYGTPVCLCEGGTSKSITEHEFDAAVESGKDCHVFLLSESASLPVEHTDRDRTKVNEFRTRIRNSAHCRPAVFVDREDLALKLDRVRHPGSGPALLVAPDPQPFRLPQLPGPMQDRQQAIRVSTLGVFEGLGSSVPNAANSLQSRWTADAKHDDQTAIWALTTLTRALESGPLINLVPALSTQDHSRFSDGIKLLMRLFVCRGFSEDGWQRLRDLSGKGRLEIADLWLVHSGAQAATGRDFDLPKMPTSGQASGQSSPSSRFFHHLQPTLSAGFGLDLQQQISGEMQRQFIGFTAPRPSADAGADAQLDWGERLAAHVRNRGRIESRHYAVAQPVTDEPGAAQLADAARPFGALPLAYVKSRQDDYLAQSDPALDLLDALQQCQTALHRLTPSPTHQP